jgi:hypothetical protein
VPKIEISTSLKQFISSSAILLALHRLAIIIQDSLYQPIMGNIMQELIAHLA